MKRVFVDSGGWFAHLVAEDASHAAAHDLFGRALHERWSLVTTNVVVIETYALLINRALDGRRIGLEMLDDMGAGLCRVVRLTAGDEAKAIALLGGLRIGRNAVGFSNHATKDERHHLVTKYRLPRFEASLHTERPSHEGGSLRRVPGPRLRASARPRCRPTLTVHGRKASER